MARYSLYLFGLPRLRRGDAAVAIERNKAVALLVLLALEGRPHSRTVLAALFWPESSAQAARNNLRHSLTMLRRGLGAHSIATESDAIRLDADADLWVDVREFRQLLARARTNPSNRDPVTDPAQLQRWAAAAALYTQDFLTGFSLPDCPDYDDWQRGQASSLRHAALETLHHLARGYQARREFVTARDYAERGLALEGTHEPLGRLAMQIYAHLNDRAAIQRTYTTLVDNLRRQLDVEPDPQTNAAYAALRQSPIQPPSSGQPTASALQNPASQTIPPAKTPSIDATGDDTPDQIQGLPRPARSRPDLSGPHLQTYLSPLLGRGDTRAEINRLLGQDGVRLITLVGPGGVGKTRLAQQIALDRQADFADGIFFVSLASIRAPHLLLHSVAQALDVQPTDKRALAAVLYEHLQPKTLFLILDNFEQILSAARLVLELLAAAPALKVLVTSREPLRIDSEVVYQVAPLATPPNKPDRVTLPEVANVAQDSDNPVDALALETVLATYPSIALFLDRLRAQQPDYPLTSDAIQAIGAICARVDGLPLAIELAAALTRLFTPQALLQRLRDAATAASPLRMLHSARRDLPQRQHSLWQTLDWSYDLLSATEQAYLRALSVFAGGSTLESAHAICCDSATLLAGQTLAETLAHLHTLADKCLVVVEQEDDGNPRFSLLETVREYAGEHLLLAQEEALLKALHARHYLDLAERAEPQLLGPQQGIWLGRLEREQGNLRAVLGEEAIGPRAGAALWHFWYMRGYHSEGLEWLQQLAQRVASPHLRARILYGMSMLTRRLRDFTTALDYANESLRLFQTLDDRAGMASALRVVGFLHFVLEELETARGELEQSLALFRDLGDEGGIAATLTNLAYVAARLGDRAAVQLYAKESLTMRLAAGNLYAATTTLAVLGLNALFRRDNQAAAGYAEQSLQLCAQIGNRNGAGVAELILGHVALAGGDHAAAQARYLTTYRIGSETVERSLILMSTTHLGLLALQQGKHALATDYLRQNFAINRQSNSRVQIAEMLVPMTPLALASSQPILALRMAGALAAARERLRFPSLPTSLQFIERTISTAHALVDADAADAAWQSGQTMTIQEIMDQIEGMFAQL